METLVLVVIVRFIMEIVKFRNGTPGEPKPQSVCVGCSLAHVQYAQNGRTAISCTFGGGLRPVKLNVSYCTDFRDRTVLVQIAPIGFAAGS
jgi:hypothetical protein